MLINVGDVVDGAADARHVLGLSGIGSPELAGALAEYYDDQIRGQLPGQLPPSHDRPARPHRNRRKILLPNEPWYHVHPAGLPAPCTT
jgi:hypothetical protein